MPSPTERLERRKQLQSCRVCAWLSTLDEKNRKLWQDAIFNTRFGSGMLAQEIMVDIRDAGYQGESIGESSIDTHRRGMHR